MEKATEPEMKPMDDVVINLEKEPTQAAPAENALFIRDRIFKVLKEHAKGEIDWESVAGPPTLKGHVAVKIGADKIHESAPGGFQFNAFTSRHSGRVAIYLMEDETYTLNLGKKFYGKIPESGLGKAANFLVKMQNRILPGK